MEGFSSYNQIEIRLEDQHKMTFICPWGTFAYKKNPFGIKNVDVATPVGHDVFFSQLEAYSRGLLR
jgi:hypothetical protein